VVATYKINFLTYLIAQKCLKFSLPYFTLPSLLLNQLAVPEFIQGAAHPENIAEEIVHILKDPSRKEKLIQKLKAVKQLLGSPGVIKKVAEKIAHFLQ
jgi:lipid-A-disaccharide synthase